MATSLTIDLLTGQIYKFNNFSTSGGTTGGTTPYTEVNTYADLPAASGTTNEIYWVKQTTGSGFLFNRKVRGFYQSDGSTWNYGGDSPAVFSSNLFRIYDSTDKTKEVQFILSGLTTSTARNITIQDKDGTLAYLSDITASEVYVTGGTYNVTDGTLSLNDTSGNTVSVSGFTKISGSNTQVAYFNSNGDIVGSNNFTYSSGVVTLTNTTSGGRLLLERDGSWYIRSSTLSGNVVGLDMGGSGELTETGFVGLSINGIVQGMKLTINGQSGEGLTIQKNTGDGYFSHRIITVSTTNSTSTTTGALVVAGGVGIGNTLYVGGDISVGSNPTPYNTVRNIRSNGNMQLGNHISTSSNYNTLGQTGVDAKIAVFHNNGGNNNRVGIYSVQQSSGNDGIKTGIKGLGYRTNDFGGSGLRLFGTWGAIENLEPSTTFMMVGILGTDTSVTPTQDIGSYGGYFLANQTVNSSVDNYGIYAKSVDSGSGTHYAGYFVGNVIITGTLSAKNPYESVSGSTTISRLLMKVVEQTSSSITTTLWASPEQGDKCYIINDSGGTNTINGNGNNIEGTATVNILTSERFTLFYNGTEWKII